MTAGRRVRRPDEFVPPRFGTPRDESFPTYGGQIAEVAARLGTPLMPEQRYVMDVAFEYEPASGELLHDDVTWTIMRQSGKTTGVRSVVVHRSTVVPLRKEWGRKRQVSLYTAQTRGAARRKLQTDFADGLRAAEHSFTEITNVKARPGRATRQWKLSLNNGQENIHFGGPGGGSYLWIEPPTREAGHGDTVDLAIADEAFAHQTAAVEEAARPAMQTRFSPQFWRISTAGDEKSYYFWPKVRDGRRLVESGKTGGRSVYFEWSLPPEADIDDEDAWWTFMPALGRTVRLEYLRGELERARSSPDLDAEDLFRRMYCNQWVRVPIIGESTAEELISPAIWSLREIPPRADGAEEPIVGDVFVGVDCSPGGRSAALAVAGRNRSGRIQVEVAHFEAGTFWLEERLRQLVLRQAPAAVAYDYGGPARVLAPEIVRGAAGTQIARLAGREWTAACEGFVAAFDNNRACHLGQDSLSTALEGARRKYRGAGWLWDPLTALADITPLCAATAALRAAELVEPHTSDPAPPAIFGVTS